jgi:hypothetical protein
LFPHLPIRPVLNSNYFMIHIFHYLQ